MAKTQKMTQEEFAQKISDISSREEEATFASIQKQTSLINKITAERYKSEQEAMKRKRSIIHAVNEYNIKRSKIEHDGMSERQSIAQEASDKVMRLIDRFMSES